jgi:hypothetical protein
LSPYNCAGSSQVHDGGAQHLPAEGKGGGSALVEDGKPTAVVEAVELTVIELGDMEAARSVCMICYDDVEEGEGLPSEERQRGTGCAHTFCRACIKRECVCVCVCVCVDLAVPYVAA